MDVETITKLLDAGYTKADIDSMQGAGAQEIESGENAAEGAEIAAEEQGNASAENAGEINAAIAALTETVKGLSETVKAMQSANAKGAATDKSKKDTINDVMKSFIDTL